MITCLTGVLKMNMKITYLVKHQNGTRQVYLQANMIKENSVIIDVGINRIKDQNVKGYSIIGDADLVDLKKKTIKITPVPGGVGPMTISMLVENTVESAEKYGARSSAG